MTHVYQLTPAGEKVHAEFRAMSQEFITPEVVAEAGEFENLDPAIMDAAVKRIEGRRAALGIPDDAVYPLILWGLEDGQCATAEHLHKLGLVDYPKLTLARVQEGLEFCGAKGWVCRYVLDDSWKPAIARS